MIFQALAARMANIDREPSNGVREMMVGMVEVHRNIVCGYMCCPKSDDFSCSRLNGVGFVIATSRDKTRSFEEINKPPEAFHNRNPANIQLRFLKEKSIRVLPYQSSILTHSCKL